MNALTLDLVVLASLVVGPAVGIIICLIILAIMRKREREALRMAKTKRLYDSESNCIGRAEFRKSNGTVKVTFNDDMIYANITLSFEEFEDYKKRFKFRTE